MHRSGTSLTAQWINKCGIKLGTQLIKADVSNKDGYYEDKEFNDLHEEIFKDHDIPHGGFINIENFTPNNEDLTKLKKLVERKNNKFIDWGWKEPRTCLFIDSYMQIIPHAKVIIVIRDYNAVINSLIKRAIHEEKITIKRYKLSKIKLVYYNILKKESRKRFWGEIFSKATIVYYKKINEFKLQTPRDNFHVLNFSTLKEQENETINRLLNWGFNIKPYPLNNIIKKDLITSSEHCNYISEKYRVELEYLSKQIIS